MSTHGRYVEQIRPLLLAVATATGLVLLIACANVGVLLTLRATRRRREMAVRQALGATAGQITRACAAEPLLLGAAATALGLGLAWATITAIAPVMDHYLGRPAPGGVTALSIDPATLVLDDRRRPVDHRDRVDRADLGDAADAGLARDGGRPEGRHRRAGAAARAHACSSPSRSPPASRCWSAPA